MTDRGETRADERRPRRAGAVLLSALVVIVDALILGSRLAGHPLARAAGGALAWLAVRAGSGRAPSPWPHWRLDGRALRWTLAVGALVGASVAGALGVFRLLGGTWSPAPFCVTRAEEIAPFVLGGLLVAPILEEWLYRGLVQTPLESALGPVAAVLLSAAAFWASHWIAAGGVTSPHHLAAGVLLGWVRVRTGSLTAPTALHAAGNAALLALDILRLQSPDTWSRLTGG